MTVKLTHHVDNKSLKDLQKLEVMELSESHSSELTDEDLKRRKQLSIIFYVWHRKPLDSSYTTAVLELSVILAFIYVRAYDVTFRIFDFDVIIFSTSFIGFLSTVGNSVQHMSNLHAPQYGHIPVPKHEKPVGTAGLHFLKQNYLMVSCRFHNDKPAPLTKGSHCLSNTILLLVLRVSSYLLHTSADQYNQYARDILKQQQKEPEEVLCMLRCNERLPLCKPIKFKTNQSSSQNIQPIKV
ncbi:hypothetical protein Tsp_12002 [Trichinella spiralis]|uniref:hypothetical protein n=1 Tax=Trichinella spiralis TaxID=6334 RepID=UPI0001EFCF63|nr:hypothetical protein Tsp_12002 [Trichinella spiralis]